MPDTKTKAGILVVDDNKITCEVIQRNLTSSGYRVFVAHSVTDAALLYPDTWHRFGLIGQSRKGKKEPALTENAIAALQNYAWPGNVRELENLIQRSLIMNEKEYLHSAVFPNAMKNTICRENNVTLSLDEVIRKYVRDVVAHTGGNKAKALKILKIDRKTLLKKL